MQPGGGVPAPDQLHPPVVVHARAGLRVAEVEAQLQRPEQLPARDAARAAHAAGEDRDLEGDDGAGGEAAEGGGVEVEAGGGGGGGLRRGGGADEGEEGGLGGEVLDLELGVAWGGGGVDAGAGGAGGGGECEG